MVGPCDCRRLRFRTSFGPRVTVPLPRFAAGLGLAASGIGFIALAGWALGIETLRSAVPGRIEMNPATAVGFLFLGGALALRADGSKSPGRRTFAVSLALIAGAAGLLRLTGYLLAFDPLVDRVLFPTEIGTNRMAPNTSLGFLLAASALALLDHPVPWGRRLGMALALGTGFLSFLTLLGHGYGATFLYTFSGFIGMAIPTAAAFLLVSTGILAARPEDGPLAVLRSELPGGAMARSLLPAAIALPVVLGYLRKLGQEAGLFGTEFGFALLVGTIVALLTGVIVRVGSEIDRTSDERDRIFRLTSDLLCVAGADGLFKAVNPAWTATLGYTSEEMEGKPFLSFIHPDDRQKTAEMADAQAAGSSAVDFENRYRAKDGTWRTLLWRATPVQENRCIYAVARDITLRKEEEREKEMLMGRLAAANRELEAFSYSVSHDLRAPLRAADGFSRILLEEYGPRLDDEGRRLLGVIRDNTVRMGRLIDDLLDFSRMGRKTLESEETEMNSLVARLVEEARIAEPDRKIEIDIGNLPPARGDRAMLRQAWANLVSNAFKYTRRTPYARIEIGGRAIERGIEYWIRDNGAGFDPRYAEKLFGVFQRLHAQTEFEGTGVGLALVKRIVTRHGGEVSAASRPGAGATFRFTLPKGDLDS